MTRNKFIISDTFQSTHPLGGDGDAVVQGGEYSVVNIACDYTDFRRGIDGLSSIVAEQFQLEPFRNTLFLFCGRRRDCIKALYWEGSDFVLLYKRLKRGSFSWPRNSDAAKALTLQQYRWLME